jgi:hypothetical protein
MDGFYVLANTFTPVALESDFVKNIVSYAAMIGGAILAIFLIVGIVKDGIAYAKGGGSIFPIIGKALFLILCIGLIFLALQYKNIGNKAATLAEKGINIIETEVRKAVDGGA